MFPESPNDAARVGALAYLISVVVVVYVQFGIHQQLFVAGHPAETAQNILAGEGRYHFALACDVIFCVATVISAGAYYAVVARFGLATAMISTLARLFYAAAWFLATIRLADVLRMVKGADYLANVGSDRLQALALLRLNGRGDDYYIGLPFWAVSATLLAYLWFRSGYVPRRFALVGIVASAWAILCAFAYLAAPRFANVVNLWWFDSPMVLFELIVAVWLLIRGLRPPIPRDTVAEGRA